MQRRMTAFRPSPATPVRPSSSASLCSNTLPSRPFRPTVSTPVSASAAATTPRDVTGPYSLGHPNPAFHTRAINRHAKLGNLPALKAAVRTAQADNYVLNAVNFTTIINAHIEHGRVHDALAILADMRAEAVHPTNATMRIALKAANRIHAPLRASAVIAETFAWVSSTSTEPPCTRTWNMVMQALIKRGALSEALSILRAMCLSPSAPPPSTYSYNQCMSALGRARRFRDVLSLFADMSRRSAEVAPDVVTFNALLDAALYLGANLPLGPPNISDAHFVRAVIHAMHRRGVIPNILTETLILRLISRHGCNDTDVLSLVWTRVNGALSSSSTRTQLDKPFFDAAISAFAQCASPHGMSVALDAMLARRVPTDERTVRAVLQGAARLGDAALAGRAVTAMEAAHVRVAPGFFASALAACRTDKHAAQGMLQTARAHGMPWTADMLGAAIVACGNDCDAGVSIWQSAQQHAGVNARVRDRVVYEALARVCGRAERPDLALKIVYAARRVGDLKTFSPEARGMVTAFERGLFEALGSTKVRGPIKSQYLRLLHVECGSSDNDSWPIERIRLRF